MMQPTLHTDDPQCNAEPDEGRYELPGFADYEPRRDEPAYYAPEWAKRLDDACLLATMDLGAGQYTCSHDGQVATVRFEHGAYSEVVCHVSLLSRWAHIDEEADRVHDPVIGEMVAAGFDIEGVQ